MMTLVSGLAPFIESLLEIKHAIGLPYTASARHLGAFDALCAAQYPGQTTLTDRWRWNGRPGVPGSTSTGSYDGSPRSGSWPNTWPGSGWTPT
jgi:hypothetical protein